MISAGNQVASNVKVPEVAVVSKPDVELKAALNLNLADVGNIRDEAQREQAFGAPTISTNHAAVVASLDLVQESVDAFNGNPTASTASRASSSLHLAQLELEKLGNETNNPNAREAAATLAHTSVGVSEEAAKVETRAAETPDNNPHASSTESLASRIRNGRMNLGTQHSITDAAVEDSSSLVEGNETQKKASAVAENLENLFGSQGKSANWDTTKNTIADAREHLGHLIASGVNDPAVLHGYRTLTHAEHVMYETEVRLAAEKRGELQPNEVSRETHANTLRTALVDSMDHMRSLSPSAPELQAA